MTDLDPADVEDSSEAVPPSDAQLRTVADLAAAQREAEDRVVRATAELRAASAALRRIAEEELPEAMRRAGVSDFKPDGLPRVRVEDRLTSAQITEPEALAWLEANGGAALIKTSVEVEMDRGDLEVARRIYEALKLDPAANRFRRLSLKRLVWQGTGASFAKEKIEAGLDPPLDLLRVTRTVRAVVGRRPRSVELHGLEERE